MSRRLALVLLAALTLTAPVLIAAPAAAGGSCHEPSTSVVGTEVGMTDGCFTPSVLHVRPGQTVTFRNPSSTMHTVSTNGGEFGSELPPDDALRIRFDEPGVIPYFCHYHLGMVGAIVVTDVTPADLGISADPAPPVEVADPVEDVVDDVTDGVDDLTGVTAAASSGSGGGPAAGVAAIVAGALGIGAGLVLRGRLRMPARARERAIAG